MGILIGSCMSAAILIFNIFVVVVVALKTGFKGDTAILPFIYDPTTMYVPHQGRQGRHLSFTGPD